MLLNLHPTHRNLSVSKSMKVPECSRPLSVLLAEKAGCALPRGRCQGTLKAKDCRNKGIVKMWRHMVSANLSRNLRATKNRHMKHILDCL